MAFKHFWVQYKLGNISDQAYIKADTFVIGRAPECDLPIPTDVISRRHLKVYLEDDKIWVKDLGSTNGTLLMGEQLKPNEKYEYTTGNRLYLDSGKECSIRITAIYERDGVDFDLEKEELGLERKRQELQGRGRINSTLKTDIQPIYGKEKFLSSASESVDNIFDNLVYIAKSARFNKEKQIREAQNETKKLVEDAKQEIEEYKGMLEKEIEAQEIDAANKAKKILKTAKAKAEKLKKESEEVLAKSKEKAQKEREEVIVRAQDRHGQIIAEAHLKNKELKEENQKIEDTLKDFRDKKQSLSEEIDVLQKTRKENEELALKTQKDYNHELSNLNALKVQVMGMEKRNEEALHVQESKIPGLQKEADNLKDQIQKAHSEIMQREKDLENVIQEIENRKDDTEKAHTRATQAEKRLDELNKKLIDAENNLFKLTEIKQQRNDEIEREIAERRSRQQEAENRSNELIKKKQDKADKEISVNVANAKDKVQQMIKEAQDKADEKLDQAKRESEDLQKTAQDFDIKTRSEANAYSQNLREEADSYSKKIRDDAEKEIKDRKDNFDREVQEAKDNLLADTRKEAKEITEKANIGADKIKEKAEKEIAARHKETDEEINDIRKHAVNKMEEQRIQLEKEELERNQKRVLVLRKELNDVLRARISPFLKDQEQIGKVGGILEKSINAIMLDEVDDDFLDVENFSDIDPTMAQDKVKKFWMVSGGVAALVLVLFFNRAWLGELFIESGRSIAAQSAKETKKKIEKMQAEADQSKKYEPEKVEEYKDNYTDRVRFTKDYVRLELNKEYREKWILKLQEYFIDELRLKETHLVPFIAQEVNLIRELQTEMEEIDGNFVEAGVERMREIEAVFIKKLKETIKKKKDFKKIMKFKQEFFENNKNSF